MNPPHHVTLRDIARKLGVSHTTVGLALRDSPEIPEARRKQIQATAKKMGYEPNPAAAALSHFKRNSVVPPVRASMAWINLWPKPEELRKLRQFDGYWRGAEACAAKFGYRLEEFALARMSPARIEEILLARGVDGILLTPPLWGPADNVDFQEFHWERFCVLRLSRSLPEPPVHVITADQAGDALLAFDEMRARGYERIGFVTHPVSPRDRTWFFVSGFLKGQEQLPVKSRLTVFYFDASSPSNLEKFTRWLGSQKPDALLSAEPEMEAVLEKCGYRVPADIGLATVNVLDCPIDAGIDQNPEEVGRVAVLQLISLIHDNDRGIPPIPREVLVKGKWVDGASLPQRA